jgi:EAL domain-containing protein (putative c-di-GMP-specific phosphodiesterase class I)
VENHLRRALEQQELTVFYQPQVQLATMRVVGSEALVRWRHPEWGLVSPGEFIPVAEDTGLIQQVDEFVLRAACAQTRAWQQAGHPELRIAANLSAREFRRRDLVEVIASVLAETGLDTASLEVEITESVAMENVDLTLSILEEIGKLGVHMAIDDFGTGYSSLQYLARFPVHTLKIDRSFVKDMLKDAATGEIVRAMVALTHALKRSALAEGVETQQDLDFLRGLGCDDMQGFFFSKPVPAEEFGTRFLGL